MYDLIHSASVSVSSTHYNVRSHSFRVCVSGQHSLQCTISFIQRLCQWPALITMYDLIHSSSVSVASTHYNVRSHSFRVCVSGQHSLQCTISFIQGLCQWPALITMYDLIHSASVSVASTHYNVRSHSFSLCVSGQHSLQCTISFIQSLCQCLALITMYDLIHSVSVSVSSTHYNVRSHSFSLCVSV